MLKGYLGRADLYVLSVVLIWGSVFSVVKFTLVEIDPLAFVTVRFAATAVLLLAVVWWLEGRPVMERRDWRAVAVVGIVGVGLYQIFFTVGIDLTTASNSSLIIASAPIWVALLSAGMGYETIRLRQAVGIALSFLGVLLVIRAGSGEFSLSSESLRGDLLSLGAAVTTALGVVVAKEPLRRHSALRLMAVGIVLATGFVLLPIGIGPTLQQDWGAVSLASWLGLGYAVVFSSVIAYVLWYAGVAHLGPVRTAVYGNLIPVVAVTTAAITLGERLTMGHLVGAGVVLLGITLARWPEGRPTPAPRWRSETQPLEDSTGTQSS